MELIVISPESEDPRERESIAGFFRLGLRRYHSRKPSWRERDYYMWIQSLPEEWRSRIVVNEADVIATLFGLGGCHRKDSGVSTGPVRTSRSCHDIETLRSSLGNHPYVIFGPVFPSLSKEGYGPDADFPWDELRRTLAERPGNPKTKVFAIGGVTADRMARCKELGFDGVAVHGAVWGARDPVEEFRRIAAAADALRRRTPPLDAARRFPLMCLTLDDPALSHARQATQMCKGGAKWIQLRMKGADRAKWIAEARECAGICRDHGAVFIVNDSVEVALESGADGVHLGSLDQEWRHARRLLGEELILGGTVNNSGDARRAVESGCLNYVGVGPLRYTATKKNLAPILGFDGVRALLSELGDLPAWVIGGVDLGDLPELRAAGAAGVALSSALRKRTSIGYNVGWYLNCWRQKIVQAEIPVPS